MSNSDKILIIDECENIAYKGLIYKLLKSENYIILSALSWETGLERLNSQKISIIIYSINIREDTKFEKNISYLISNFYDSKIIIILPLEYKNHFQNIYNLKNQITEIIEIPVNLSYQEIDKLRYHLTKKISLILNIPHISEASDICEVKYPLRKTEIDLVKAIGVASSTGGPKALEIFLKNLQNIKMNIPIFITQHIADGFSGTLAKHLSSTSGYNIKEAVNDEEILDNVIYLAPSNYHMTIIKSNNKYQISLNQNAPENFCRPSAEPMFRSLSDLFNNNLLAIFLTGMGQDGSIAAEKIAKNNGYIISQDEKTSTIWGMPGAVAKKGLCNIILPLEKISQHVLDLIMRKR